MPSDGMPPSEFGGKQQKNRVQPRINPAGKRGHTPDPSEELMLSYTTGYTDGLHDPDAGEAFEGLLPVDIQSQRAPKPELFSDFDEAD
jgi:hypothetical protein